VALRCTRAGRASLSSHGRRLASASVTCRRGRASVRFTLSRRSARSLKHSHKPGLVIAVRAGTTTAKLHPRLAR
jgi:hypothetical protein